MVTFEIYAQDLTEQAKAQFKELTGLDIDKDTNYDVFPIATVDIEEEE